MAGRRSRSEPSRASRPRRRGRDRPRATGHIGIINHRTFAADRAATSKNSNQAGCGRSEDMRDRGHQPEHRVYGLVAAGRLVYVGCTAAGKHPWRTTWANRARLNTPLARLLQSIGDDPPEEVCLLGAVGLCQGVGRQIATVLGEWTGALVESPRIGGTRRGRPCTRIMDGVEETWPSRTAAAAACGVNRKTITRRLAAGGSWVDGEFRDV